MKALDTDHVIWHSAGSISGGIEGYHAKIIVAITAAAFSVLVFFTSGAQSEPYAFGDPPYTLNWWYYPQIQSGCWKWNWQNYLWNDYCPAYVTPKAYMYPRGSRAVLRTRG